MSWPNWKLKPEVAAKTQGLVVTGFGALTTGRALMLKLGWDKPMAEGGGRWLDALLAVAPATSAAPPRESGRTQDRAAALGLSFPCLRLMGLGSTVLASFSRPFREGMLQEDRLRRLGDRRGEEWQPTVIKGGPVWSANGPGRPKLAAAPQGFHVEDGAPAEEHIGTDCTAHAVLMLYSASDTDIAAWDAEIEAALKPHDVIIERRRDLYLDALGNEPFSREHFGFADGLSQPEPYDAAGNVLLEGRPRTAPTPGMEMQCVPLGEILLGYVNGHREPAPCPVVPEPESHAKVPDPAAAGLERAAVDGFYNLGLNGSYMVVRELQQDVPAFWKSMEDNAARIRAQDPQHSDYVTGDWIAQRVIGRDRNGNLLCPLSKTGVLGVDKHGEPDNHFYFWDRDRYGLGCPTGSHVRRANPRDSLAPVASEKSDLLAAANNHRILRRGRKYGKPYVEGDATDSGDRGLLFACLNTDIARQFEFVQQTWLLNSTFATLYKEVDPLIGAPGPMTIREDPLRRILHVETYVRMVGGDYYFLPSLPALTYLSRL